MSKCRTDSVGLGEDLVSVFLMTSSTTLINGSSLGSLFQSVCLCSCCIYSCLKIFILVSFIWNILSLNIFRIFSLTTFGYYLLIFFSMNTSLPMLFKFLSSPFPQSNFHFLGRQSILFGCFQHALFFEQYFTVMR